MWTVNLKLPLLSSPPFPPVAFFGPSKNEIVFYGFLQPLNVFHLLESFTVT